MSFTSENPLSRKKELNRWELLLGCGGSRLVWKGAGDSHQPGVPEFSYLVPVGQVRATESLAFKDTPYCLHVPDPFKCLCLCQAVL